MSSSCYPLTTGSWKDITTRAIMKGWSGPIHSHTGMAGASLQCTEQFFLSEYVTL